jgi:hypothetical protein
MAIKFLDNLDLNGNQLLNSRLEVLASDPGSANSGDIIYNSTSNVFKFYNGSAWIDPSAGSYTSWQLSGDSGSGTIVNASQVTLSGTGAINTALTNPTGNIFVVGISIDAATSTQRGAVELFSDTAQSVAANSVTTTASRTYGLQLNAAGQGVVNVPWTDTSGMTSWNANIFGGASGPFTIGQDGDLTIKPGSNMDISLAGSNDAANYTIGLANSGVTAASYTNASITVNAKGLITSASSGTVSNTTYTLPTSVPFSNVAAITLTGSDSSTDVVNFIGATNQTKINAATQGSVTIGLADNVSTVGDLTVGGGDITLSGTGRIQGIDTVSAGTDAVNKTYVDNSVVGNLVFQGGYNAASNTPDLDSNPSSSIKKGWAYVVTDPGSFFSETVEVGDFLFAQSDAPTALSDWVTVQNNVGLATISTVGIGNVNAQTGPTSSNQLTGIDVRYSSGTAQVGIDIRSQDNYTAGSVDVDNDLLLISQNTDVNGDTKNNKITLNSLKSAIGLKTFKGTSASGTTHTFTHNLNTRNVMVQLFDTSSFDTVYATVVRTSVNVVTVTTAASADITCLISEV